MIKPLLSKVVPHLQKCTYFGKAVGVVLGPFLAPTDGGLGRLGFHDPTAVKLLDDVLLTRGGYLTYLILGAIPRDPEPLATRPLDT